MKLINEDIALNEVKLENDTVSLGYIRFARDIWPRLVPLLGTDRGVVIDVTDLKDPKDFWIPLDKYKELNKPDKMSFRLKMKARMRHCMDEIKSLHKEKNKGGARCYDPKYTYVGNGKVAIYWHYAKPRGRSNPDAAKTA